MRKRIISIIATAVLFTNCAILPAYALDNDGQVDLYQVFSNSQDKMKNQVGSRIYKWSMHLPDDAIIQKSDRVNEFRMMTNSYQAGIELFVEKNNNELTLEEMLYKMQTKSNKRMFFFDFNREKELVVDIAEDEVGKRYIRIIKSNQMYDQMLVDKAATELGEYIENRIYIENNYIYNLTITMKGAFYREHEEMFNKLASSFKLSFDEKNPYIKELADSVSEVREFKNASYGWKIMMNPYWKVSEIPNARVQTFSPVYTDEELSKSQNMSNNPENLPKVVQGISVNLVSTAEKGDTASKWAESDIQVLKDNYNSKVYEILKNEAVKQGDMNIHNTTVLYKTLTKTPYVVQNSYVVGNGYKYLVTATMMEEKYKDTNERKNFETMLNSFSLEKSGLSPYLGKIVSGKSLIKVNDSKDLKMKKYNFETKITKSWKTSRNGYDFDSEFNSRYSSFYDGSRGVSNDEYVGAINPASDMQIDMTVALDTSDIKDTIKKRFEFVLENDEVRMGLQNIKICSAENNGAQLYYIEKEYDIDSINRFINEDKTKEYDLEELKNEYTRIVKVGKDVYTEIVSLPLAKVTEKNKETIKELWENTSINKIRYGKTNLQWMNHNNDEFKNKENKK